MRVSQFKNALKGGGARANLFEVELSFPSFAGSAEDTRLGQFLIKSAQFPASSLGVIEAQFRGRILKIPGDRIFTEWTVTVLNDTDFALRNAFERWSNSINTHEGNVGPNNVNDALQTASVFQLDRDGQRVKEYTFNDLWPSEIGAIEVSSESSNQLEEYTVTFQYSEWISNTTLG